jgi:Domain of unknown function (DUF4345)
MALIAFKMQAISCFIGWRKTMSKRLLQYTTSILGLIPVATGIIGLMGVSDPLYVTANIPKNVLLDSNLRFFSGAWLGLGLTLIWLVPRIDSETAIFRILWGMIFLGGIGRLLSMIFLSIPPIPFIAFTALEIIGAPLFVIWQSRIQMHK